MDSQNVRHAMDKRAWKAWKPGYECTTCFILDGKGNVLLIERKKEGFGNGKVAAPGGHLEEGETLEECAIREIREEVGLEVSCVKHVGVLNFAIPGNDFIGHVYISDTYSGKPSESEEATPFWNPVDDLPYSRMFDDDLIWINDALKGRQFELFAVCNESGDLQSYDYHLLDNPRGGK